MIIPLNDRVILKKTKPEEKSAGGIVLPSASQEQPNTAVVLASANDALHAGDIVLFGKYAGKEVTLNGETVLIVEFKELIAKIS